MKKNTTFTHCTPDQEVIPATGTRFSGKGERKREWERVRETTTVWAESMVHYVFDATIYPVCNLLLSLA